MFFPLSYVLSEVEIDQNENVCSDGRKIRGALAPGKENYEIDAIFK